MLSTDEIQQAESIFRAYITALEYVDRKKARLVEEYLNTVSLPAGYGDCEVSKIGLVLDGIDYTYIIKDDKSSLKTSKE